MGGTYPRSKVDLGGGRGWLTAEAAASIHRIDAALGHMMQITEAGRTWAEQDVHYQHYLKYGYPIALNPDTPSIHQIGDAVDSDEAQKHIALLRAHGWERTVYRWVNGKWTLVEPWHFEYSLSRDQHRNDPAGGGNVVPVPPTSNSQFEEETMSYATFAVRDQPRKGSTVVLTTDLATGEENEFESSNDAKGDSYNRNVALTYGGSPLVPVSYISLSHYNKIKQENAERRARLDKR